MASEQPVVKVHWMWALIEVHHYVMPNTLAKFLLTFLLLGGDIPQEKPDDKVLCP